MSKVKWFKQNIYLELTSGSIYLSFPNLIIFNNNFCLYEKPRYAEHVLVPFQFILQSWEESSIIVCHWVEYHSPKQIVINQNVMAKFTCQEICGIFIKFRTRRSVHQLDPFSLLHSPERSFAWRDTGNVFKLVSREALFWLALNTL